MFKLINSGERRHLQLLSILEQRRYPAVADCSRPSRLRQGRPDYRSFWDSTVEREVAPSTQNAADCTKCGYGDFYFIKFLGNQSVMYESEISLAFISFSWLYKWNNYIPIQAVNKLAEIMARKDTSKDNRKKDKVSSADMKKKEKEYRKLQLELNQVRNKSNWQYYLISIALVVNLVCTHCKMDMHEYTAVSLVL